MPKVSPMQNGFGAGEFSPLMYGRTDVDRYKQALSTCFNYVPTIQGGLTRRPGTEFIAEVKDVSAIIPAPTTSKVRLINFQFSTTQAYIIEFGHYYCRFYKNDGQILDGFGDPYEITSSFADTDIFDLKFTQSADLLYIVHPQHVPKKLGRRDHTDWFFDDIQFSDGPYMKQNNRFFDITPSAATGTSITLTAGPSIAVSNATNNGSGLIKITASSTLFTATTGYKTGDKVLIASVGGVTAANGTWTITIVDDLNFTLDGSTFSGTYTAGGSIRPGIFKDMNVGSLLRIKEGSTWGRAIIRTWTSVSVVVVDIFSTLTNTNAKTAWRLGAFGYNTGFPSAVVFHEDRLFFAGTILEPQRLDGSNTGDYENFAPSGLDGTVIASNAVSFILNSNDVNATKWMTSDERGLVVGSAAGEWVVRSASSQEAISPTSINAKRVTSYGSQNIQAVQAGKASIFVQKAGRKLREFTYFIDVDGYRANDLSILADHITLSGIVQLAFQQNPHSLIWGVREDGVLLSMTYERDLDSIKVGWSRHELGGISDAGETHAVVESAACIPSSDGLRDELWLVVKRYIDGNVVRYIEVMSQFFEDDVDQKDAFFVDCGLTYDNPKTISAITNANPGVVTATSHGFLDGDTVVITDVEGMNELNNNTYTVANKTTHTFELLSTNTTSYGTYVTGGFARKKVTTISGLDHLEGEEVTILGDGAPQTLQTVTAGAITLSSAAAVVHIGFGYNSDGQMLRLDAGAADGTAMGKTRRTNLVSFMLHRSLNLLFGTNFDDMTNIKFRVPNDPFGQAPALYSGIITETTGADYDYENQLAWRQDQPLPSTLLAIFPQMTTQDR